MLEPQPTTRVVYVTADWCHPCHQFRPIAQEEFVKRGLDYTFVNVERDDLPPGMDFIGSLPTIVVMQDTVEVARTVGAYLPSLKAMLDEYPNG